MVAPCAGAWVEMAEDWTKSYIITSLPVRERGLKFFNIKAVSR